MCKVSKYIALNLFESVLALSNQFQINWRENVLISSLFYDLWQADFHFIGGFRALGHEMMHSFDRWIASELVDEQGNDELY